MYYSLFLKNNVAGFSKLVFKQHLVTTKRSILARSTLFHTKYQAVIINRVQF